MQRGSLQGQPKEEGTAFTTTWFLHFILPISTVLLLYFQVTNWEAELNTCRTMCGYQGFIYRCLVVGGVVPQQDMFAKRSDDTGLELIDVYHELWHRESHMPVL